ncbi:aminotransferase-like domain-containing protein [Nonomuraea rhodomycinica]|uniref:Aminotransferase class I/II-fold pyridoxal phosphate-dependent enzyme n=1 Tax=Nonomuraea rhodomycinica TaxID=1712872 RepID=A0A7Y6MC50_9ACTN|nr:aminotransferase class I/II-fold pyridoxal phosphate-dependent enzyme [Nonomuraea rhodomycinica]NUW42437.1 aminotransferase class I/II-fold pyridoxal phosphate-dependent enzyme [Nonomuraea rhodomycinica]
MRSLLDLPVSLERNSPVPLSAQLAGWLRQAMLAGTLAPGERLPSSRGLAGQLGVSRTVITEAYQQLYAEGWLEGRHGSGTFVADLEEAPPGAPPDRAPRSVAAPPGRAPRSVAAPPLAPASWTSAPAAPAGGTVRSGGTAPVPASGTGRPGVTAPSHGRPGVTAPKPDRVPGPAPRAPIDLRPGKPWVRDYDVAAWKRAWRRAADLPPGDSPDPYGLPRLRELLAGHLRRARAVAVGPENIIVTRGTGNGLDLCALALLGAGTRAGVEDPGYHVARTVFAARGAEVVPCPVDEDGVVSDGLPGDLRLLYTTPAHQYPLGGRLPIPRRERLLAWARRTGAMIVEDDYDAEFRYDVAPLPALYGLDPSRVVLLGTLSKTLAPDVGVGWLVGPPELVDRIAGLRRAVADRTSGPVQQAVATLIERGDLDRHLRRMRLEYARRRAAVVEILGPLCRLRGDTAGLHVLAELPPGAIGRVVERAAERGVLLDEPERHRHRPGAPFGLVIGYGSASLPDVRRACRVVADLISRPS